MVKRSTRKPGLAGRYALSQNVGFMTFETSLGRLRIAAGHLADRGDEI
jgi:hypothetical protein